MINDGFYVKVQQMWRTDKHCGWTNVRSNKIRSDKHQSDNCRSHKTHGTAQHKISHFSDLSVFLLKTKNGIGSGFWGRNQLGYERQENISIFKQTLFERKNFVIMNLK